MSKTCYFWGSHLELSWILANHHASTWASTQHWEWVFTREIVDASNTGSPRCYQSLWLLLLGSITSFVPLHVATFLHSYYFKEQDFGSSRYKLLFFFILQNKVFSTLGLVSAIIIKGKKEVLEMVVFSLSMYISWPCFSESS